MRHKPNLDKRMAKCESLLVKEPTANKGKWTVDKPLYLEIGCGKGSFTVGLAKSEPEADIVALERVPDAMIMAMEKTINSEITNIRYIDGDAAAIKDIFDNGELNRIYINFCDPWPKSRDAKFRLTAPGFLRKYADLLKINGEIRFKTDNKPLFDWSLEQFEKEGWKLVDVTYDLHSEIMTDYEAKFISEGMKINGLTAIKVDSTKSTKDGEVERLRNASLSDARMC